MLCATMCRLSKACRDHFLWEGATNRARCPHNFRRRAFAPARRIVGPRSAPSKAHTKSNADATWHKPKHEDQVRNAA